MQNFCNYEYWQDTFPRFYKDVRLVKQQKAMKLGDNSLFKLV